MTVKQVTLRLPAEEAEDLALLAQVEGTSANEYAREAILARVAAKKRDPKFKARIRELMERNAKALERLSK